MAFLPPAVAGATARLAAFFRALLALLGALLFAFLAVVVVVGVRGSTAVGAPWIIGAGLMLFVAAAAVALRRPAPPPREPGPAIATRWAPAVTIDRGVVGFILGALVALLFFTRAMNNQRDWLEEQHAVLVGDLERRYGLQLASLRAQAPPAAASPTVAAPASPARARQLRLAFAHGSCAIAGSTPAEPPGSDAAAALRQFAAEPLPGAAVVDVVGYADASGDALKNQRLSECRAAFVRDRLVAFGVPLQQVSIRGGGIAASRTVEVRVR